MRKSAFLLLACALTTPGHARAACGNLEFQSWQSSVDITSNTFPTVSFAVKRTGNNECVYFVTCDYGGAAGYSSRQLNNTGTPGASLPVQICLDGACSSICKQFPDVSSNADVIADAFPNNTGNGATQTETYRPKLGAIDYQRFGTYENAFVFKLYEGTLASYQLKDQKTVTLKYVMNKKIDLSLVDAGGAFDASATTKTVNLGTLATGVQGTFDLLLKFNAGYRVVMQSQNQGRLKHGSQNVFVPYGMTINGSGVSFSGGNNVVIQGTGVSPAPGLRLAGRVTVGTVAANSAVGTYQDTINIQVATTE